MKIESEKAQEWFNKNWQGSKLCPICENKQWQLVEEFVEIRNYNPNPDGQAGVYPSALIVCVNCGNTLIINAIVAGFAQLNKPGNEQG